MNAPAQPPAKKRRRLHPAPAGRVMATGVSLSATLGIMAVLAANQPQWVDATAAADPAGATGAAGATATTIVEEHVSRTIVLQPGQAPPAPGETVPPGAVASADGGTATAGGGTTAAAAPADTSGGTVAAPAPDTVASAPVVTSPPATTPPTTAPPAPACTGSKC